MGHYANELDDPAYWAWVDQLSEEEYYKPQFPFIPSNGPTVFVEDEDLIDPFEEETGHGNCTRQGVR